MIRKLTQIVIALSLSAMLTLGVSANAATGWRSDGTGMYPDANPVIEWSTTKNVAWKAPLPEWGNCMPVLVGDRIFLTVETDVLICLSAKDGSIMWQKATPMEATMSPEKQAAFEQNKSKIEAMKQEADAARREANGMRREIRRLPEDQRPAMEARREELQKKADTLQSQLMELGAVSMPATQQSNGYSSPTPVSDGQHVFVMYGTGVVAAFDLDGNRLWAKLYEQPTHQWGHSTSPLLVDGKLITHVKTMIALDPATGEKVWQTPIEESWGTPAVTKIGDTSILVTAKGDVVRTSDGHLMAKDLFELPWGSPIIHDGVIYGIDEAGGHAYALPNAIEGDTLEARRLWSMNPPRDRYYASPVVVDGILYTINRGQRMLAVDISNGDILYQEKLNLGGGGQLYGSFCLAGDHLFVGHENGQMAVLKPGRTLQVVQNNALENTRSTPIFAGDKIYFRTENNLYCIAQP